MSVVESTLALHLLSTIRGPSEEKNEMVIRGGWGETCSAKRACHTSAHDGAHCNPIPSYLLFVARTSKYHYISTSSMYL